MSEFIKVGNKIVTKPNGLDCDLVNGKVYNLKFDRFGVGVFLEEDGSLSLPKKVYTTKDDEIFVKRVINYFNNTSKLSTGVMLSGIKGTGKTVMAKVIAEKSNLPIFVVDEDFPTHMINDFFRKFSTPVVVIFDEVDKHWDTENLLGWLDGVQTNAKKLVLFTCNNEERVNCYLKDRCSRVRYSRHFEPNDNARFLKEILKDKGIEENSIDSIYKFIVSNFDLLSIDNILSFIDEKLMFPEISNYDLLKDLNITTKEEEIVEYDSNEDYEDDNNDNDDDDMWDDDDYEDETERFIVNLKTAA